LQTENVEQNVSEEEIASKPVKVKS
jgi:hypothetical protein